MEKFHSFSFSPFCKHPTIPLTNARGIINLSLTKMAGIKQTLEKVHLRFLWYIQREPLNEQRVWWRNDSMKSRAYRGRYFVCVEINDAIENEIFCDRENRPKFQTKDTLLPPCGMVFTDRSPFSKISIPQKSARGDCTSKKFTSQRRYFFTILATANLFQWLVTPCIFWQSRLSDRYIKLNNYRGRNLQSGYLLYSQRSIQIYYFYILQKTAC